MKKNTIRLNEAQLKRLISEAVKDAIHNYASSEPQFDINSDEWSQNYDKMRNDVVKKENEREDALTDLQIKHHFSGQKGKGDFEGDLPKQKRSPNNGLAKSPETIETQVMRALDNGKSPEEITNLKLFSPEEIEYIKEDCLDWLDPVGTIDEAGKIVFYDARKDKFVSFEDDREY